MRVPSLAAPAALFLFLSAALPALALEVTPVTLVLPRDKPVATLHIRNREQQAVSVELLGYRWRQEEGEDIYTEEPRLIITPPLFRLAPGETRMVRAGLLDTSGLGAQETAFRLLVRDITGSSDARTGLRIRMQMLLPVFLEAETPREALSLNVSEGGTAPLCLTGKNEGTGHEKLIWLETGPAAVQPAMKYFLAGSAIRHCLDAPRAAGVTRLRAGTVSAQRAGVRIHDLALGNAAASRPRE